MNHSSAKSSSQLGSLSLLTNNLLPNIGDDDGTNDGMDIDDSSSQHSANDSSEQQQQQQQQTHPQGYSGLPPHHAGHW